MHSNILINDKKPSELLDPSMPLIVPEQAKCSLSASEIMQLGVTAKLFALAGVRTTIQYVYVGGIAVYYFVLLAPDVANTQTCENAWQFLKEDSFANKLKAAILMDAGDFVFNVAAGVSALVIPFMHRVGFDMVSKACRNRKFLSDETEDLITAIYQQGLQALSNPVSIISASNKIAETFQLSNTANRLMYTTIALPLGMQLLRLYGQKYFTSKYPDVASWPTLKENFKDHPKAAIALTIAEAMLLGVMTGSSFGTVASYGMNVGYSGWHDEDYPYTDQIILLSMAFGALLGAVSILKESSANYMTQISTVFNLFYLIAMPLLSQLICFVQELGTVEGYIKDSWLPITLTVFSMFAAYFAMRLTKNDYVSNVFHLAKPLIPIEETVVNVKDIYDAESAGEENNFSEVENPSILVNFDLEESSSSKSESEPDGSTNKEIIPHTDTIESTIIVNLDEELSFAKKHGVFAPKETTTVDTDVLKSIYSHRGNNNEI